jgi:glycosyltransferase involved in cell wall biosynthesis
VGKSTRRVERTVRNELSRRIPSRSTVSGEIWAISMVKNEVDIIEASIRHCFDQGIDAVLVADNGSTDGTRELIRQLSESLPIILIDDPILAYEQDAKMTALANGARRLGAKWIVPFDADEFWYAETTSLGDRLRSERNAVVVYGDLYNSFPVSRESVNAKTQMAMSDTVAVKKVAFRAHRFASLCMGSNEVYRGAPRSQGIHVLHIPWRSKSQMSRKLSQGKLAVLESRNKDWAGGHWVRYGDSAPNEIEKIWESLINWQKIDGLDWNPTGLKHEISGIQNPYEVTKKASAN